MSRRQLPAGRILKLFMAGANVTELALLYECSALLVQDAIRRQIARSKRGGA
jgi:Mor family transcriptional regulator